MNFVRSSIETFAKLVGVRKDLAEDGLHSERLAKHMLSRRGALGAMAALASGAVFSGLMPSKAAKTLFAINAVGIDVAASGCEFTGILYMQFSYGVWTVVAPYNE